MNLWWAQKEQKTYFEQFLPENKLKVSNFKHASYPIGLLYKLYYLLYSNAEESFGIEFFENGRDFNLKSDDDHWELYETLIHLHQTLQMWFTDPLLYHWIGYIIFRFKGETFEMPPDENNVEKEEKGTVISKRFGSSGKIRKQRMPSFSESYQLSKLCFLRDIEVLLKTLKM